MADVFMFAAQPVSTTEEIRAEKPSDCSNSAKRARSQEVDEGLSLRKPASESFKSKLVGASSPNSWNGFGSGKEKLIIDDGDVLILEEPTGIRMKLSDELKLKLCKPWENALILKVMGRPHTLNFMISKLRQKWSLIGNWQLTDLEDGYFVVRFQRPEDLTYVLTEGPWVITNQYIVVQRWRPNFVPGEEEITKMPVWVRLSKLPMEWIDVNLLWKIGGLLGTTFKVDPITESQARGRYARICVEIDTTKPLKSCIFVEDRAVKVEYENLGLICFKCGRVGHSREGCKDGCVEKDVGAKQAEGATAVGSGSSDSYGPWMQVTYGRNYRSSMGSRTGNRGQYDGFRAGNQGTSEKPGTEYGPSAAGDDGIRQNMDRVNSMGGNKATRSAATSVTTNKTNQLKNKKTEGSRFAILSEYDDGETSGKDSQRSKATQAVDTPTALAEISNLSSTGRRQLKISPNKYLVDSSTDKNTSKPSKVTFIERGPLKPARTVTQIHDQPVSVQQEGMEEDLDDSEVLQSLHKDLVEAENAGLTSSKPFYGNLTINDQQVDVAGSLPFDDVASKLKEAMAMTLE